MTHKVRMVNKTVICLIHNAAKYENCAVRTQQWRFVNNSMLFDVSKDPGEQNDMVASHPEVVDQLRKSYNQWWDSTLPFLVNENLPKISVDKQPLAIRYYKQLKEQGIPDWAPDKINQ